jgi:integrase/recombinase XerC
MTTPQPLDIHRALKSFNLALRAQNKSPGTVKLYSLAVRQLTAFLERVGHSCEVGDIERDDINGYLSSLHEVHKPSTVDTRYRSLQAFFKFLRGEDEILESPMRNMRPPQIPEILVPVLSEDDLKTLLKSCEGRSFEERRDTALIRLFISTGARRGELINLRYMPESPEENDLSLDPPTHQGHGKGKA